MTYPSPPDDVDVTYPRVPPQYTPPLYRPGSPRYTPPAPPPETSHRATRPGRRRLLLGGVFVAVAIIALGVGVVIGATRPPVVRIVPGTTVTETVTAAAVTTPPPIAPTAEPTAGAAKPATSFSDGQWLVGEEIRPGTYRTTVPSDSYGCYWERERGTSGQFSDVIANDSVNAGRRAVVTIKSTDRAFKSDGCGTWRRESSG